MNRIECIDIFARLRGDAIVVVGPGFAGHELVSAEHNDLTLYNMDMGYAVPLCLGLALTCPAQQVVAIEGDGSMLMALGSLTTVARYAPGNLTVIVFDNGYYLTTGSGGVATATARQPHRADGDQADLASTRADLAAVGRAAGLRKVISVKDVASFEAVIRDALAESGPWLVVARVDTSDKTELRARGAFPNDLVEQSVLFQVALRATGISRPA